MTAKPRRIGLVIATVLALASAGVQITPAHASAVCPASFTDLSNEVSGGGIVTFDCPTDTTITFSNTIAVSTNVTLDASTSTGTLTFDGGDLVRLFTVGPGVNLTLDNLTLTHGFAPSGDSVGGGAVYNDDGTVVIDHSTLSNNSMDPSVTGRSGGAIYNYGGTVTIQDQSVLSGNSAGDSSVTARQGGAIGNANSLTNFGIVTIDDSTLTGNGSTSATNGFNGGAIFNYAGARLTIQNHSLLSFNHANGEGGAILNLGSATIDDSTLLENSAVNSGGYGGAIYNNSSCSAGCGTPAGAVTVQNGSALDSNSANDGAAIYNSDGSITVDHSTVAYNAGGASSGGFGAIDNAAAPVGVNSATIIDSTVSHNTGYAGAAIRNAGTLSIAGSTIADNTGNGAGGAIFTYSSTSASVITTIGNSTLAGNTISNSSTGTGGTIYNAYGTQMLIANTTISSDESNLANGVVDTDGSVTFAGSIVSNPNGNTCHHGLIAFVDDGYNLEWTGSANASTYTCGFSASTDITGQDPLLSSLASNGGPTQTMALQSNSPAIDQIPPSATYTDFYGNTAQTCPSTDQRGATRPDDSESNCDIGAYESGVTVDNPVPLVTSISPKSVGLGTPTPYKFQLTVSGSGFLPDSTVWFDGAPYATSWYGPSQLVAIVYSYNVAPGANYVTVSNPTPGGGTSNAEALYGITTTATVTSSDSETGTSSVTATTGGTGPGTDGSVTATGTGDGTVSVALYSDDPGASTTINGAGAYMDVSVASGSSFTSLTIVDCNLGGATEVYWYDGTNWVLVSPQSYNAGPPACVTMTLNDTTSSPTISQLTGTFFLAGNGQASTSTVLTISPQMVQPGGDVALSATVSSSNGDCTSGDVQFDNNGTNIGSAVATNSSGVAGATYSAPLTEGVYPINATFTPTDTANCVGSSDQEPLTVAQPGGAADGGGSITVQGSGKTNFGFTVRNTAAKNKPAAYSGQFLLISRGGMPWRLKGSLSTYGTDSAGTTGYATGTGELYWMNSDGDWVAVSQGTVSFGIQFTPTCSSGGKKGGKTGSFGLVSTSYVANPSLGDPSGDPAFQPQTLSGGSIQSSSLPCT